MSTDEFRTVAILGGSYGGNRAAQILAAGLPSGWRVVLIDRNSHFNHVYNFPRYTVLPGHEHKAFIPYDRLLNNPSCLASSSHPHKRVHGTITSLHPHHITYTSHAGSSSAETEEIHFDYAIYALGSHLPSPINLWGSRDTNSYSLDAREHLEVGQCTSIYHRGTKHESISRLCSRQRRIKAARQVLVVGGGALGIQFASDIAAVYPRKHVTLLHSRSRLLPKFDEALGYEVYHGLEELGVHVILGERLDMSSLDDNKTDTCVIQETMCIKTTKGREIEADLVLLCTGQIPNTSLLRTMNPYAVNPESGMISVSRTMQIMALRGQDTSADGKPDGSVRSTAQTLPTSSSTIRHSPIDRFADLESTIPASPTHEMPAANESSTSVYPHLFAIGDAADAFGAIKAGHTAYYQGEVAARNIIKLIKSQADTLKPRLVCQPSPVDPAEDLELEEYEPSLPAIKISLGLTKSAYEVGGVVGTKEDGTDDLRAATMWGAYGYRDIDEEAMRCM